MCAIFRRYLHGKKLKFTPERAMILDAVLRKTGLFEAERLLPLPFGQSLIAVGRPRSRLSGRT